MENSYTITQTESDLEVSDETFKRFTVNIKIPELDYDDTLTTRMIIDSEDSLDPEWIEMNCEVGVLLGMFGDIDVGDIVDEIVNELEKLCHD
tara:strand:- start:173 stop:448 length:276 start_codon:yes stop_codon:yes gene_type:complete